MSKDFAAHLQTMATTTPTLHIDHAAVLRAGKRRRTTRTAGASVLAALAITATGAGVHALVHTPAQQRPASSAQPTPAPAGTPFPMPTATPPTPPAASMPTPPATPPAPPSASLPTATPPIPPTTSFPMPTTTPPAPAWRPPQPLTVDGVTALVSAEQGDGVITGYDQAVVSGELVLLDGGCIGLQPRPDVPDIPGELAVWPPGTTVLANGEGIDVPGAGPIRLGQQIHHSGGHSNRENNAPLAPAIQRCTFTASAFVNPVTPSDDILTPPG